MVKWNEQLTPACPHSGQTENARHHVWLCPDPAVFFIWALLMSSCSAWLESVQMAKEITYWIIQCLTEWCSTEPFSSAQTDLPGVLQAIEAQDHMGWLAFFEGCNAVEWAAVQQASFLWLGQRNAGKCWVTSMVVELWEVAWDLWDHRNQIKRTPWRLPKIMLDVNPSCLLFALNRLLVALICPS
jgi:hypothetical protein